MPYLIIIIFKSHFISVSMLKDVFVNEDTQNDEIISTKIFPEAVNPIKL